NAGAIHEYPGDTMMLFGLRQSLFNAGPIRDIDGNEPPVKLARHIGSALRINIENSYFSALFGQHTSRRGTQTRRPTCHHGRKTLQFNVNSLVYNKILSSQYVGNAATLARPVCVFAIHTMSRSPAAFTL